MPILLNDESGCLIQTNIGTCNIKENYYSLVKRRVTDGIIMYTEHLYFLMGN